LANPWRTIQKAANSATPGSVVYVRGGTYNESIKIRVSGSENKGYITFRNYPNEAPIVDGANLVTNDNNSCAFLIDSKSYILIRGFEICNFKTSTADRVPIGILIKGTSHHIKLQYNKIHNVEHNRNSDSGVDAHGIAVYGTNPVTSINNIIISNNKLYSLKLGSSEALVINGNVKGFKILYNTVHDCNNIGIDAIGFEGTSSDPSTDQARNGYIIGNIVYNISSYGNPAYGDDRSAGGIYIDGGRSIVIERNFVHHNNIGIEIASEHSGKSTTNVVVRNNFIYLNELAGISMGGYDTLRGSTIKCKILNNTLYYNDRLKWNNGELQLQYNTRSNIIKNNIFYANSQNCFITNPFVQNVSNDIDFNMYYSSGGQQYSKWQWMKVRYTSFRSWRTGTGNDTHSLFINPLFITTGSHPNLHLKALSPAINRGCTLSSGSYDIDENQRVNNIIDMGADEYY